MINKENVRIPNLPRVLLVDDEEAILQSLSAFLRQEGWEVVCAGSAESALEILQWETMELVISDLTMPGMDGLALLEKIKEKSPDTEVIIVTGNSTEDVAIQALKKGAFDYFRKPFKGREVLRSLLRTKRVMDLKAENERLRALNSRMSASDAGAFFLGPSPKVSLLISQFEKIAASPGTTVLLTGESGVGKEVAARMLHTMSLPSGAPFIGVNCGGISEGVLERELFGHEKGAFTGADRRMPGVFEMALGGTILLDEITEMSLAGQSRLLRVLEGRSFRRVGGATEIPLGNTRIIAASNKDLEELMRRKKLREDLFYRLQVIRIHLPPLRERREDILPLARYFIEKSGVNPLPSFSPEAEKVLREYPYPGNIRELKNAIHCAAVFHPGEVIHPSDLPLSRAAAEGKIFSGKAEEKQETVSTLHLEELEKLSIRRALSQFPSHSAAARALGISPQALYRKKEKYNL